MKRRICKLSGMAAAVLGLVLVAAAARGAGPKVRIETSAGNFVVQLENERAPLSVQNFLQYARDGFYEGTIFHRVVSGFVIQGGGYDADLAPKATRPGVPNESGNGLINRRGTIAMARTGEPHSADAQFYVNLADNLALDPKPTRWGYAVFGEVIEGMDVVDEIGHQATAPQNQMQDVPLKPVMIKKVVALSGSAP